MKIYKPQDSLIPLGQPTGYRGPGSPISKRAKSGPGRLSLLLAIGGLCACGTPASPKRPLGDAVAAPRAPADRPASGFSSEAAAALVDSIVLLGARPDPLDPTVAARAMRQLARSLRPLSVPAALQVSSAADHIEDAPPNSLSHGYLIKQGLNAFLAGALSLPTPPRRHEEYQNTLAALRDNLRGVSEVAPLREQRTAIAAAFRCAADTVLLAHGREAAFRSRPSPQKHDLLPVDLEVERARVKVAELARRRWSNGREEASLALSALADLMVAASAGNGADAHVAEIRFQAERLGREKVSGLGEAGWVSKALDEALDGLQVLTGRLPAETSSWTRAARQAVDGIETRSSIGLQRAAVQDAFRATVDAYAAHLPSPRP